MKHKLKHFLLKCLNQIVLINGLVFQRTGIGDPLCISYREDVKTIEHDLLNYTKAQMIWKLSSFNGIGQSILDTISGNGRSNFCKLNFRSEGWKYITLTINILWQIWKVKKSRVFNKEIRNKRDIINIVV